jgi:ADP-ribose pyrophosphatase YjhB (NUDIX family)
MPMTKLTLAEQAGHPETPPGRLLELARQYPEAVLANPARELLSLESPAVWVEIWRTARLALVRRALAASYSRAEPALLRHWKCDCVERVLWLYERRNPEDPLPRQMLKTTRAYLRGECSEADIEALTDREIDYWQAADNAGLGASPSRRQERPEEWSDRNARAAAAYAARAAIQAATNSIDGNRSYDEDECPADASEDAARAAEYHAISLGLDGEGAYLAESEWQAAHFAALLRGEDGVSGYPVARDGEALPVYSNGGDWLIAWHPPAAAPEGTAHGASAFCKTADDRVVLISNDGERWGWPGGRPEAGESWEQTLRREVLEEACAVVGAARLLGFCRAVCLTGPERGLVLVRSLWSAEVELMPWEPRFEIAHRRVIPAAELRASLWMEPGFEPIYRRALLEAGFLSAPPGRASWRNAGGPGSAFKT